MNDIGDLTRQIERKAKSDELTQLERDLFNTLLKLIGKEARAQATLDKIDKALAERGIES